MDFAGKTIWITGAASGMGRALALALSPYKGRLILSDRDAAGLAAVAAEVRQAGAQAEEVALDMADSTAIAQSAQQILAKGFRIDALYHFAGISQRSFVHETPLENDRRIMEVNFFGVVALTKALLPHMLANGGGQLAAASSLVGKFGFPYRSAYAASKHALHGFFESLAVENHTNNIRVSMLIGGRIQTNISKFAINKEGREHGQMDPGQANGISAEKAAQQILRGLKKERAEIPVGGSELLILKIRRFFPALHRRIVRKIKPM